MRIYVAAICFVLTVVTLSYAGESRTWTDTSGTYKVEAELIAVDGNNVTLKTANGREINLQLDKLCSADQDVIAHQQFGVANTDKKDSEDTKVVDSPDKPANGTNRLTSYQDLDGLIKSQREAQDVVNLINGFLATGGIDEKEKTLAKAALLEWQSRADKQAIRVGTKWMSPDEFEKAKNDEIHLIKEAHRLIDLAAETTIWPGISSSRPAKQIRRPCVRNFIWGY
jgi:hypothetical protein